MFEVINYYLTEFIYFCFLNFNFLMIINGTCNPIFGTSKTLNCTIHAVIIRFIIDIYRNSNINNITDIYIS